MITSQLCLTTERFLAMDVTTIFWESLVSPTKTIFIPLTGSEAPCIQTLLSLQLCRIRCQVWNHARAQSLLQTIRHCRAQVISVRIHVLSIEKVKDCHPALEDQMNFPLLYLETVSMELINDPDATTHDNINETGGRVCFGLFSHF